MVITVSHNNIADNCVKIADPSGSLARRSPSLMLSPMHPNLIVLAIGIDMGVVTTPQLHGMVRARDKITTLNPSGIQEATSVETACSSLSRSSHFSAPPVLYTHTHTHTDASRNRFLHHLRNPLWKRPPGASLRRTSPYRSAIMTVSTGNDAMESKTSLTGLAPLEAILFDVDGTLCDSDPLHHQAFQILLQEIGFNGGVPIDEQFFIENIAGKHGDDIARLLFPDDIPRGLKFMDDKEALFRKLASEQLTAIDGLYKLTKWVEDRGLKRAAVTNAPKVNAELLISRLGLSDFFQAVILGSECQHGKPHPEPYLKALEQLKVSKEHTMIFEDSVSGIKAGVAAGMPVIGLTTRNPEHLLIQAKPTFLIKNYDDPKLWEALEELDRKSS